MTLIEARNISRTYGSNSGATVTTALQPTSLRIEEGEFVSIVGPSGSGKSTLMNLLGLLDKPTSGQLFLEGVDCGCLDDNQLARIRNQRIGFVFQAYYLLSRLTAVNNVELPLIYSPTRIIDRRARTERALESVGLLHKRNNLPSQLSGGEQQRVAIARAIVSDPAIVFADEPTGALDTASGRGVMKILKALNRAGRTVTIVTHDRDIAKEASRTFCMRDGRIVEDHL